MSTQNIVLPLETETKRHVSLDLIDQDIKRISELAAKYPPAIKQLRDQLQQAAFDEGSLKAQLQMLQALQQRILTLEKKND